MTSESPVEPTFKDNNRALQELARELALVRAHNREFKPEDAQHTMLLFAEGALACMTLEHFVRVVVGDAADDAVLYNLLELAMKRGLLHLPFDDQKVGIKRVHDMRNALLHGNFAQAAKLAGCASVADYFKSHYAADVEAMFQIVDAVMKQVDADTGKSRLAPQPGAK